MRQVISDNHLAVMDLPLIDLLRGEWKVRGWGGLDEAIFNLYIFIRIF